MGAAREAERAPDEGAGAEAEVALAPAAQGMGQGPAPRGHGQGDEPEPQPALEGERHPEQAAPERQRWGRAFDPAPSPAGAEVFLGDESAAGGAVGGEALGGEALDGSARQRQRRGQAHRSPPSARRLKVQRGGGGGGGGRGQEEEQGRRCFAHRWALEGGDGDATAAAHGPSSGPHHNMLTPRSRRPAAKDLDEAKATGRWGARPEVYEPHLKDPLKQIR